MDASRAEKKKRIAAKVKNQTGLKLDSAASSVQGTKRRIRDTPTEEAALEILLTASTAEAKKAQAGERRSSAGKSDELHGGLCPRRSLSRLWARRSRHPDGEQGGKR